MQLSLLASLAIISTLLGSSIAAPTGGQKINIKDNGNGTSEADIPGSSQGVEFPFSENAIIEAVSLGNDVAPVVLKDSVYFINTTKIGHELSDKSNDKSKREAKWGVPDEVSSDPEFQAARAAFMAKIHGNTKTSFGKREAKWGVPDEVSSDPEFQAARAAFMAKIHGNTKTSFGKREAKWGVPDEVSSDPEFQAARAAFMAKIHGNTKTSFGK
ncbi:putative secreted protein [Wickerhamomyces ciferrii]|uniref:Secreted protein n=1 Tax=Wickerhamomyces ciferrii (strain ATCC 14091 / BCRC 22168 / CBS 111 / JCM 3599 / NBRC 0793 / NRRL Y-1031 F-60-10) TaxID=1206466 RepID=K0KNF3_WICCF|nr:uncharacterized protein BN7_4091 [Wickerhamomyces ciferrii]CCH44526.1 putative secreted protein [Wickerhamomyces ciferrii]